MKHFIFILKIGIAYILGVMCGSFLGCVNLGAKYYLSDYWSCVIAGPIVQPRALIFTWLEEDFLLEQVALGIGIILLIISFVLSLNREQWNHLVWGVFSFACLLSISTSMYVVSMIY